MAENNAVTRLQTDLCKTFSVGESGHSDRCTGPKGYQLIFHDRGGRTDIEIVRPFLNRNQQVLRLVDFLGPGQNIVNRDRVNWLLDRNGKPIALAISFDVEPRAYDEFVPVTLVVKIGKEMDCVIGTITEGSRRTVASVFDNADELACRAPFPR